MSVETKRSTLAAALAEYRAGLELIEGAQKRRVDDGGGGGGGGDAAAAAAEAEAHKMVDECLEVERALNYNCGVANWYLADLDRTKVSCCQLLC